MKQFIFHAGRALELKISLEAARFGLQPSDLFGVAVRQNSKRPFLIVSRVLGKHIPVHPAVMLSAGKLLALAYAGCENGGIWADVLKGKPHPPFDALCAEQEKTQQVLSADDQTLIVGFAETATGLARAVADCFAGERAYISTTRLEQPDFSGLTFDEAHSHARTHRLYLAPNDPFMAGCRQIMLVDDELTTGNTALRLIRELHRVYGVRRYVLLTILDCSDSAQRQALEQELGISIRLVSLLRGRYDGAHVRTALAENLVSLCGTAGEPYAAYDLPAPAPLSCRTLCTGAQLAAQRAACRTLAQTVPAEHPAETLYLGTGEFIYAPALLAGFAGGASFHSTTQSPVFPLADSAIASGVHFDSPDCYSPTGYLYNIPERRYNAAVLFAERDRLQIQGLRQLAAYLRSRGVQQVSVVAL